MPALDVREHGIRPRERRYRLIGAGCLAIPIAIVTVFAVAEGIGREPGWWGHLIQLAIGLGLAATAWFAPRIGGPVLIGAGLLFSAMMLWTGQEWVGKLSAVVIVFVPLTVAGVFFWRSGQEPDGRIES